MIDRAIIPINDTIVEIYNEMGNIAGNVTDDGVYVAWDTMTFGVDALWEILNSPQIMLVVLLGVCLLLLFRSPEFFEAMNKGVNYYKDRDYRKAMKARKKDKRRKLVDEYKAKVKALKNIGEDVTRPKTPSQSGSGDSARDIYGGSKQREEKAKEKAALNQLRVQNPHIFGRSKASKLKVDSAKKRDPRYKEMTE